MISNKHLSTILLPLALSCGCGGQTADTDGDQPAGCDQTFVAGEDDREAIQTALIEAGDDTTLCFSGNFEITTDRLTAQDKVGLKLRGIDEGDGVGSGAVFDFGGTVGPTGFKFSNMTGVTLENFSVLDVAGDGVEIRGSTDVTMRGLKISYPESGNSDNGAYALYPVESTNVLVEDCQLENASDAGIYVGQSTNILVRNNVASGNVSGVQIENSMNSEVVGNTTFNNTVGIFVHDLPAVPAGNGGIAWIHDNESYDNNTVNFAPDGIIAKVIPPGLGMLVMAIDNVEVNNNNFYGNNSTGLLMISFKTVELLDSFERDPDPDYDPYPETYYIHDNMFSNNGQNPDGLFAEIGFDQLGDITWDGFTDPDKDNADGSLNLCIRNNEGTYLNMNLVGGMGTHTEDLTPHDCEHPSLSPVDLDPAS